MELDIGGLGWRNQCQFWEIDAAFKSTSSIWIQGGSPLRRRILSRCSSKWKSGGLLTSGEYMATKVSPQHLFLRALFAHSSCWENRPINSGPPPIIPSSASPMSRNRMRTCRSYGANGARKSNEVFVAEFAKIRVVRSKRISEVLGLRLRKFSHGEFL